jgi:hypothetical protein
MSRFLLNVEDRHESEVLKAKQLERNFYALRTSKLTATVKEIIAAHRLRHLSITNCSVNAADLNECLEGLKLLESFTGKTIRINDKPQLRRVKFNKLTELKIEFCDIDLILAFDTDTLVRAHFAPFSEERGAAVLQLLKKQHRLKHLMIGGYLSNNFFSLHGVLEIAVGTLESFRIERGPINPQDQEVPHDKLLKFLGVHRGKLKALDLIYPVNPVIYNFVINTMTTTLRHLDIPVNELSKMDAQAFGELTPNNGIKSIRFVGMFTSRTKANAIMDLFPSLTSVDMSDHSTATYFMQILIHLALTQPQIEVLKIPNLFHEFNNEMFFPNLQEFYVKSVHDQDHFNRFIRRHARTLERVTIASTNNDILKGLVIEELIACPHIKFISLAAKTSVVMRKFNRLVETDHEWTLEFNLKEPSGLKFVKLKFIFPQDKAIFQDKVCLHSQQLIGELSTLDDMGLNRFANKYK